MKIILEPIYHKGRSCLALRSIYNFEIKEYLKRFNGVYWSKTHRSFYLFYNESQLMDFKKYMKTRGYLINSKPGIKIQRKHKENIIILPELTAKKTLVHQNYLDYLKGRRYSESTIAVYGNFVLDFLRFTGEKEVNFLNEEDVRYYIQWAVEELNYSVSTHRQLISSIKLFAVFYPACSIDIEKLITPKRDKKLPVVLNKEEVLALFAGN